MSPSDKYSKIRLKVLLSSHQLFTHYEVRKISIVICVDPRLRGRNAILVTVSIKECQVLAVKLFSVCVIVTEYFMDILQ